VSEQPLPSHLYKDLEHTKYGYPYLKYLDKKLSKLVIRTKGWPSFPKDVVSVKEIGDKDELMNWIQWTKPDLQTILLKSKRRVVAVCEIEIDYDENRETIERDFYLVLWKIDKMKCFAEKYALYFDPPIVGGRYHIGFRWHANREGH